MAKKSARSVETIPMTVPQADPCVLFDERVDVEVVDLAAKQLVQLCLWPYEDNH
jgi:hypothetical protein